MQDGQNRAYFVNSAYSVGLIKKGEKKSGKKGGRGDNDDAQLRRAGKPGKGVAVHLHDAKLRNGVC